MTDNILITTPKGEYLLLEYPSCYMTIVCDKQKMCVIGVVYYDGPADWMATFRSTSDCLGMIETKEEAIQQVILNYEYPLD